MGRSSSVLFLSKLPLINRNYSVQKKSNSRSSPFFHKFTQMFPRLPKGYTFILINYEIF